MTHHSLSPSDPDGKRIHRDILDIARVGLFSLAFDGRLISANQALADMYGYATPHEMIAAVADFFALMYADGAERSDFLRLLENRVDLVARMLLQKGGNGRKFWGAFNIQRIRGEDKGAAHYRGVVMDVTAQRLAEEGLRESEERYRRITEGLSDYLYTVKVQNGQAVETRHSPACIAVTGYASEEFAVDPYLWINMVVPEERDMVREHARQVLAGMKPPALEHRVIRKDGVVRWVSDTVIANVDAHGMLLSYDGLIKDITERKQMEEALRQSEARVRTKLHALMSPEGSLGVLHLEDIIDAAQLQMLMDDFFNLTKIGSAIVDIDGKVLVATGWQDICTKYHRVHPQTRKHCIESDTALSAGSTPGTFKLYKCKNNMWDMVTPIMVGDEHLGNLFLGQFFFEDEIPDRNFFCEQARRYGFDEQAYLEALDRVPRFSRDTAHLAMAFYTRLANLVSSLSFGQIKLARAMAEQRRIEEELRWVNSQLEQSLADKDKFFSIIAHDIRSPFIGFLSFIRLMSSHIEQLPPEDVRKLAEEMRSNAENLLHLLDNLLEWARLQRGFTTCDPRPQSLRQLLQKSTNLILPMAREKQIALQCDMPEDIMVLADYQMIDAVVRNLLFNAVKFTKRKGSIQVKAQRTEGAACVSVRDDGVGMDQQVQAKLFALDKKISLPGTEGERGTGLGLILCSEFIAKNCGRIWVESTLGEGTTFFFTLPLAQSYLSG